MQFTAEKKLPIWGFELGNEKQVALVLLQVALIFESGRCVAG